MDETDRIVFRSSVYLFIFPTNTIKQLTKLLHICIFIYIMYIYIYINFKVLHVNALQRAQNNAKLQRLQ